MLSRTNQHRALLLAGLLSFIFSIYYSAVTDSWGLFLCAFVYFQFLKIFANHIGIHRLIAHKSFKTGPWREKFLTYSTVLLSINSPISYALVHRHHHKHSDTEKDVHSPQVNGFFNILLGLWEYNDTSYFVQKGCSMGVRDLLRNKDLVFIDKHYHKIWAFLIVASLLISWKITIFFLLAPAGYFHIAAGMLNTFGHWNIPGSYRNYDTDDKSYNNWIWGIYSCGEGFQNNHHGDQNNYDFGRRWFEIDIAALLIKLFFDKDYHFFKKS